MTLNELKTQLCQKYQIDCFLSLNDLEGQPSSTLYRQLSPLYQEAYDNNYRFVFFNFAPVQQTTLNHLVSVIDSIDISRYFVLVLTNQNSTVDYFSSLDSPIVTQVVDNMILAAPTKTADPLFANNSLCARAWAGIHIMPGGEARPCCDYQENIVDTQGQTYNIKTATASEIMSSGYMNQVRAEFRQGKTPRGCVSCLRAEASGGQSKRMLTPYKLENIHGYIDWESDCVDRWPRFVGGHLGNLCNLKCRICNPAFSSSIAVEELSQSADAKKTLAYKLLVDNNWSKDDSFWKTLKNNVPHVCNFEFIGGEPLLLKSNLDFMQYLLDTGYSTNSIFEFITNGTQFPDIFEQASQFKRLTITVSIDNIGDRFEFERSGAVWSDVEKNIDRFLKVKSLGQSLKLGICVTVNIQNVLYLPELIAWIQSKGIDHYFYNILSDPYQLSLNQLTPVAKTLVLEKLINANLAPVDQQRLEYIINLVKLSRTSSGNEFCQFIRSKDQIRQESFLNTHKEIAEAMGYVL